VARGGIAVNADPVRLSWLERLLRAVDLAMLRGQAWLFTRRLELLAQGLPALLLAAAFAWAWYRGGLSRSLISRYDLLVEQTLAANDVASAKVYVRKLVLLDEPGQRTRYALARLAEHEGDLPRAQRLMSDLAPYPGSGFPAAHFWIAQRLRTGSARPPQATDQAAEELIHHLEQSLVSPENRQQAYEWLGELYEARGDLQQAVKCLEEAAPQQPELYLRLAELLLARKDESGAQRAANQALHHFQRRVAADPKDVAARIAWARVCILDAKFDEAERILQEGLAIADSEVLRQTLADLYLRQADRIEASALGALGRRLELLAKALRVLPDCPDAVERLAMFLRYSGPPTEEIRVQLRELLAEGQQPATAHLLLGAAAAAAGQWDEARVHLEQAYRLDSRLPALLNHLAWSLTQGEQPDLERACRLIEEAVRLAPGEPELRGTRGRILARLQRWQEALTDLEAALAGSSEPQELHATLAEVYTALGDPDMAERHRTRAERKRDR
jgi:tetratricopeptide (TPR) repeat protein